MKRKLSVGFCKAIAVVSAIALGGCYVSWRQSEVKSAAHRESLERAKTKEKDLTMMVGSKNPGRSVISQEDIRERDDFSNVIPGIPAGGEEVTNTLPMLPGSKSISMPLFTKDQIKQIEIENKKTEGKLPQLLPGSKSSNVIPPDQKPELAE